MGLCNCKNCGEMVIKIKYKKEYIYLNPMGETMYIPRRGPYGNREYCIKECFKLHTCKEILNANDETKRNIV